MLQIQRLGGVILVAVLATSVGAQPSDKSGAVIDVSGTKGGKYPIALPTAPEGDAVAKEVSTVESFDATNLTNEYQHFYLVWTDQPGHSNFSERMFTFGVRGQW